MKNQKNQPTNPEKASPLYKNRWYTASYKNHTVVVLETIGSLTKIHPVNEEDVRSPEYKELQFKWIPTTELEAN